MDDSTSNEKKNDSFIRWQQLSIVERGKTINLFLGMSLATIGFVITQLTKIDFEFANSSSENLILVGSLLLLLSVIFLIWLTLNRLKDFRESTRIASTKMNELNTELDIQRLRNRKRGTLTFWLFNISFWLFASAESLVAVGFIFQVWNKL